MNTSVHHQISVDSKPSWGWLASAILFTMLMFFLLSWHVHYSYFIIENLQHIYIDEDYHWHNVVDLSRQITAAARAAATDLNPGTSHLEEYRKKALELDALLPTENVLQSGNGGNDSLIRARSAHNRLRTMEQSALDQIQSGQREIGLKRLFNEDYNIQEQLFLKAMNSFVDQSRHRLIDRLQHEKSKELLSLWAAFFVFLVSLSFWIMLIRRLQKWGGILSQEIREHHKAEKTANTLERKYQDLFEYANDPILILDPMTYRLLDVNRKAVDLLGYERDELLGLSLNDLILGDDQNSVEQLLKTLCPSNSTVSECTYRHKDGRPFPVEISGRLIDAGDKEVYQCFARDITERRRFQEERLHSQKIEAIGQVADGIAHDFRNALTAISGYNALGQNLLPKRHPALESLKRIDQVINQANGLIRGMLTFSRRQETERQSVELRQLVENSADLFRRILPAAITLEIDVASVQNFQVSADITQLQQVLLNLMINARDAMPDGGTLRISLSPASADRGDGSDTAGWVRIEVSDTGIGMPPEVQARIFEPFFTTKPDEYGTGLGLAMVHNIVSQHGGRVEVRSAVGQGSAFTVLLPPATPDSTQDEIISSRNWKSGAGEMILLAEDHRYVREIMAATLRHVGYEVVQAEDGLALLDRYRAHRDRLRLLIADLDLPGCSGLDALRQLRARGARLPAILITGTDSRDLSDQLDMETLLLRKPFQMATLARLVYSLLHQEARVDDRTHLDRPG
ncbi:MAG: PAS domain S-box protein [Candidatus Competibacteraceae bacterium]|nr:PAS domain S-box protein [Candidatus Competibacteraceae bacterium]